jgi:hypothetical protein
MDLINLLVANWDAVLAITVAAHGPALAIVNLTPTPKDDETLAKVYRGVELVAGLVSPKAKQ